MDPAAVLEAIAQSLEDEPEQFTLSVTSVGMQATNTGGIGFNSAPVISGGVGNEITSFRVEQNVTNQIELARGLVNDMAAEWAAVLRDVAAELRGSADESKLRRLWTFVRTACPPLIVSAVGSALGEYGYAELLT